MTTKREIGEWFDRGKKAGANYMIVVCDTFSYEDYPAFVSSGENVVERINYFRRSPMQRIMEVYDLNMDRSKQLREPRAFHYPKEIHDSGSVGHSTGD